MAHKFTTYSGRNGHVPRHLKMSPEPRTFAIPADEMDSETFDALIRSARLRVVSYGIAHNLTRKEIRELLLALGLIK